MINTPSLYELINTFGCTIKLDLHSGQVIFSFLPDFGILNDVEHDLHLIVFVVFDLSLTNLS